jgi:hypothetical protein
MAAGDTTEGRGARSRDYTSRNDSGGCIDT